QAGSRSPSSTASSRAARRVIAPLLFSTGTFMLLRLAGSDGNVNRRGVGRFQGQGDRAEDTDVFTQGGGEDAQVALLMRQRVPACRAPSRAQQELAGARDAAAQDDSIRVHRADGVRDADAKIVAGLLPDTASGSVTFSGKRGDGLRCESLPGGRE